MKPQSKNPLASLVVAALVIAALAAPAMTLADPPSRLIKITAEETLQWDVKEITAAPGEKLRVALTAQGSMPKLAMAHNFVLLEVGTDVKAFLTAGSTMPELEYIAPALKSKVLASSNFAAGGETVYVSLVAPAKPGKYPYLCTFPGHYAGGMKGYLIVK